MSTLLEKARTCLDKLGLGGDTIVAAVSGGPDSVALLRVLALLRAPATRGGIVIAHLNHQLRGEESDQDEAFARDLYLQLAAANPSLYRWRHHSIPVALQARQRQEGIETTARTIRYEWLTAVAREENASWVATGHTADDQAETVLHRLLRGTGLKGLGGIPERRRLGPGVEVIRPLLQVTRLEVLDFLAALGQPFRQDSSNADPRFLRNRLRGELLPLLAEQYNPAIVSVLCNLARQAGEVQQQEEEKARQLLHEAELPRAGAMLVFDWNCLARKPRHQIREMFRGVWEREQWPLQGMGFREWQRIAAVALGETTATDLPGRMRVRQRGQVVQVFKVS